MLVLAAYHRVILYDLAAMSADPGFLEHAFFYPLLHTALDLNFVPKLSSSVCYTNPFCVDEQGKSSDTDYCTWNFEVLILIA